jgi:hypothetical protein
MERMRRVIRDTMRRHRSFPKEAIEGQITELDVRSTALIQIAVDSIHIEKSRWIMFSSVEQYS